MCKLDKSIALATLLHAGAVRKHFPFPYITHPVDVVKQLIRWGIRDDVTLSAAVLHDVIEKNANVNADSVAAVVGWRVADIVEELTYDGPESNPETKQAYLDSFILRGPEALIIKAADRYCNVLDFQLSDPSYARRYLRKAFKLLYALDGRLKELSDRYGNRAGLLASRDFDELKNQTQICDGLAGGRWSLGGVAKAANTRSTRTSGQSWRFRFQTSYSARTSRYGDGGHSGTPSLTWRPHRVAWKRPDSKSNSIASMTGS
jgi:hypothetical protein